MKLKNEGCRIRGENIKSKPSKSYTLGRKKEGTLMSHEQCVRASSPLRRLYKEFYTGKIEVEFRLFWGWVP